MHFICCQVFTSRRINSKYLTGSLTSNRIWKQKRKKNLSDFGYSATSVSEKRIKVISAQETHVTSRRKKKPIHVHRRIDQTSQNRHAYLVPVNLTRKATSLAGDRERQQKSGKDFWDESNDQPLPQTRRRLHREYQSETCLADFCLNSTCLANQNDI